MRIQSNYQIAVANMPGKVSVENVSKQSYSNNVEYKPLYYTDTVSFGKHEKRTGKDVINEIRKSHYGITSEADRRELINQFKGIYKARHDEVDALAGMKYEDNSSRYIFDFHDIITLAPACDIKDSSLTIVKTLGKKRNDCLPRLSAKDIIGLMESYKSYPNETETLLGMKNEKDRRYDVQDIQMLAPVYNRYQNEINEIGSIEGIHGKRFNGADIMKLVPIWNEHRDAILELERWLTSGDKYRFNGEDISYLAPIYNVETKDAISELRFIIRKSTRIPSFALDGKAISKIVPHYQGEKTCELVNLLSSYGNGNGSMFRSPDIPDFVIKHQDKLELIKDIIDSGELRNSYNVAASLMNILDAFDRYQQKSQEV